MTSSSSSSSNTPTIIKKYANRRLYDTGRSSYVTLEDLHEMIQENHDFIVIDAKSKKDLTHSVLIQIVVEQEARNMQPLLPRQFLKHLIKFYNDPIRVHVPDYLDTVFASFLAEQEALRMQRESSLSDLAVENNIRKE